MQFQLTNEFIDQVEQLIANNSGDQLEVLLNELHFADIAELLEELDTEDATYIIKLLDSEVTSEILIELDEDFRERILDKLTPSEIADELEEMDTDDAADIIAELDDDIQKEVIGHIEDEEHAADIVDLLRYDEDTAGGLMAKELVRVKESWTVAGCVREMRRQAENVTRVHSIYVTDKQGKLKGRLSLKDLLTAPERAHIKDIYIPKVDYVNVNTEADEVARIMQKYDLEAIPVVDESGILVGRITIDDIVDYIKEEAEKDYQLAAGISQDVEANDGLFKQTRARLPWLLIGMMGGLGAATIISGFETIMTTFPKLLIFVPLIQATAGNVGVQSSAIIVQGLANNSLKGHLMARILRETSVALVNGIAIALIVLIISHFIFYTSYLESISIGIAIITVIIIAAIVGNLIPIFLHKRGIDPAVATGPFITTSNDVFGILTYFLIAKTILGF
ncbi:magnesium transporter [Aequorivita capsosiphonis]|uniref:magnesium transporter n=1 Tax=Aequorivita capsosiphonis TaxID=487317 RepID=UPI0004168652|nr:magnesium transporter [Aequorivita capsosiphonis]